MKRNIIVFAVMVVVVAGLLVMARFRQKLPSIPGTASVEAAKGKPAPDFTLTDLKGNPVKLSDLRGKAVVLNFWATWCPPCKEEIPWFVQMQKQYGPQGLQVVGVSMDDDGDQQAVAKFASENGVNYPVLIGKEAVARLYGGIEYLPTTFYIDRNGVVRERVFGQPERQEIEKNVKLVVTGGSGS